MHVVLACVSTMLIWVAWLIHMRAKRKPGKPLPSYRLAIEAGAVGIVAFTGYLGGFLAV